MQLVTRALQERIVEHNCFDEVMDAVAKRRSEVPKVETGGGEDQDFFVVMIPSKPGRQERKLYVVRNETGGHTIMFPEDY